MDPDVRELKDNVRELAFALSEAVEADFASDAGQQDRSHELNTRARARIKKLLTRLGLSSAGIPHLREG